LTCSLNAFNAENHIDDIISEELNKISDWLDVNELSLNITKTKFMLFHCKRKQVPNITINMKGTQIEKVDHFNFLGITLDTHLEWNDHISNICNKIGKSVGIINRLKNQLPLGAKIKLYNSLVLAHMNYGILTWGHKSNKIFKLQKRAIRAVYNSKYNAHTDPIFKELKLLKINDLHKQFMMKFYYKFVQKELPTYFHNMFKYNRDFHSLNTRGADKLIIPRVRHEFAKNCIRSEIPRLLTDIPTIISEKVSTHSLKGVSTYFKGYLLDTYNVSCKIQNCYVCRNQNVT
jgi:hypothetical protein